MNSRLCNAVVEWFRLVGVRTGAYRVASLDRAPHVAPTIFDLAIELVPAGGGRPIRLLVEVKERVSPLLALGVLERMANARTKGVPTLCTRIISERVASLCRDRGISYLDEAGNCRLQARGFLLEVEGRRSRPSLKRPKVDPFAVKSSRISRVLLANPKRGWQVKELAAEAQVSLGLAAKVKQALMDEAFVAQRDRRLYVRDPKGLLDAWAVNYRSNGEQTAIYLMQTTDKAERNIAHWCAKHGARCALTGLAGAWRLTRSVRYQQSTIFVVSRDDWNSVDELIQEAKAKRVDTGANVMLTVPEDPFVLYQSRTIEGIDVVSPLQLYLELRRQPGRGQEAAEEILKREIMPAW